MKKNKLKNKRPKYEFGSFIDNPNTDLYQNQIDMAAAKEEAANNPFVQTLKVAGNVGMSVGQNMMSMGAGSTAGMTGKGAKAAQFLDKNSGLIKSGLGGLQAFANSGIFAMGGTASGNVPVEVEGQEVGQTPNGQMLQFNGPTHENGGIPLTLPVGTEIYSNRVKVDGVSMADRKKKREKKSMSLEALLQKNQMDVLLKNALTRTNQNNQTEESADTKIQGLVSQLMKNQETNKFAPGTDGKGVQNKSFDDFNLENLINSESVAAKVPLSDNAKMARNSSITGTVGDALGMAGNIYQANQIRKGIYSNRAGDTPNINPYSEYGKAGLDSLDKSKGYLAQMKANELQDLSLDRTTAIKRNSQNSGSINVNRALNLTTDALINRQKSTANDNYSKQMMTILNQEATANNQKDQMYMQGLSTQDTNDRMDRDNFFTQLSTSAKNEGKTISQTGNDLNILKGNKNKFNLLNTNSPYFNIDINGKITLKPGVIFVNGEPMFENQVKNKTVPFKPSTDEKFANSDIIPS